MSDVWLTCKAVHENVIDKDLGSSWVAYTEREGIGGDGIRGIGGDGIPNARGLGN